MLVSELKKSYVGILESLHKKMFGVSMKDSGEKHLTWVSRFISDVNHAIGRLKSEHTKRNFRLAVNFVLNKGKRQPRPARPPVDKSEYYRQYKAKNAGDAEWVLFNRALSYLVKANMPPDRCNRKNCVKNPRQGTIEKYGLYFNDVLKRWYSSVVDAYCQTHNTCYKN